MPDTDRFDLPYPSGSEPADVPTDMQELAEAVDERLAYAGAQSGFVKTAAQQAIPDSNGLYISAPTPDRVTIDFKANSLIFVHFQARWWGSPQTRAAINLSGIHPYTLASPSTAASPGTKLTSAATGLVDNTGLPGSSQDIGFAPVPFIIGGDAAQDLSLGSLEVEIIYLNDGASLTIAQRMLRVWTQEFPASGV
jgi:hypothetical protein